MWYAAGMFIREITKKNPGYEKTFTYHRLMESVRTPKGPRQRVLLNLGHLELPASEWKTLANRIEEIVYAQASFILPPPHIESLAQHYALMLRQKEMRSIPEPHEAAWETVDLNSLSQGEFRSIGGEAVANESFRRLGFPEILAGLGLTTDHRAAASPCQ